MFQSQFDLISLLSKRSVKKQRGAIFSCKFSTRSLFLLMPIQYKAKKAKQIDGIIWAGICQLYTVFSTTVKFNVFTRNRGATKKDF